MAEEQKVEQVKEAPKPKKNHRKAKIGWSIVGAVVLTIAAGGTALIISSKVKRYNNSQVKKLSEQTFVCNDAGYKMYDKNNKEVTDPVQQALVLAAISKEILKDTKPTDTAIAVYNDFTIYTRDIGKFKGSYFTFGETSWNKFSTIDYSFYNAEDELILTDTAESRNGYFDDLTFSVYGRIDKIGEIENMFTSAIDFEEDPYFNLHYSLGANAGASHVYWEVLNNKYDIQYYANYELKK